MKCDIFEEYKTFAQSIRMQCGSGVWGRIPIEQESNLVEIAKGLEGTEVDIERLIREGEGIEIDSYLLHKNFSLGQPCSRPAGLRPDSINFFGYLGPGSLIQLSINLGKYNRNNNMLHGLEGLLPVPRTGGERLVLPDITKNDEKIIYRFEWEGRSKDKNVISISNRIYKEINWYTILDIYFIRKKTTGHH